jgi:hypothetical protein
MKNANQPINPIVNDYGFPSNSSYIEKDKSLIGLTKREYFAAMAMQGLLANNTVRDILSGNNGMQVPNLISEYSVQYADSLLDELSKSDV